jgi:hypothetical protein
MLLATCCTVSVVRCMWSARRGIALRHDVQPCMRVHATRQREERARAEPNLRRRHPLRPIASLQRPNPGAAGGARWVVTSQYVRRWKRMCPHTTMNMSAEAQGLGSHSLGIGCGGRGGGTQYPAMQRTPCTGHATCRREDAARRLPSFAAWYATRSHIVSGSELDWALAWGITNSSGQFSFVAVAAYHHPIAARQSESREPT